MVVKTGAIKFGTLFVNKLYHQIYYYHDNN